MLTCKCHECNNLERKIDEKNRVRYSCPFAPGVEWLYGKCDEPLKVGCLNFKQKEGNE